MRKNTIISLAHKLVDDVVTIDSKVIDATVGNGYDTNYLAPKVNKVYSFDILEQAINNSKIYNKKFTNIDYYLDSHENIDKYNFSNIDLIMYNLGYLPGHDKKYTTKYESTLMSIEKSLDIISNKGKIIIVIYIGHENGKIESEYINNFVVKLDKYKYDVMRHELINKDNKPPYIIEISKK